MIVDLDVLKVSNRHWPFPCPQLSLSCLSLFSRVTKIILFSSKRYVSDLHPKSHPLRMIVGTEEVVFLAFLSNSPLVAVLITKGSVIGQGYDETVIYHTS